MLLLSKYVYKSICLEAIDETNVFNIQKHDVVSVQGVGGKTSLLVYLSKTLNAQKILVSTTTKMMIPNKDEYDYIYIDKIPSKLKDGSTYVAFSVKQEGKCGMPPIRIIDELIDLADISIFETDGSAGKSLKAYHEDEPVLLSQMNKFIGVVCFNAVGKKISDETVLRRNLFQEQIQPREDVITKETYAQFIEGKYFEKTRHNILFVNQIESEDALFQALDIIDIVDLEKTNIDSVIVGSIKQKVFYRLRKEIV